MKSFRNWWYYHKWYVLLGILLLAFLVRWIGGALGLFEKKPDLQIAYTGAPLPRGTVEAIQKTFASVAGDYNKDGEVLVRLNLYSSVSSPSKDDEYYYQYASEIEMIGDITDCESYLFLMEDPLDTQKRFQILACADGSEPAADDFSVEDKCFTWNSCPVLSAIDTGTYTDAALGESVSGSNQDRIGGLFVGRRFFHDEKTVRNLPECEALWNRLALSAGLDVTASAADEKNTVSDASDVPVSSPDSSAGQPGQEKTSGSVVGTAAVGPFTVPESFDGFTLLDNKDILSASGLYYATWTSGSPIPYQNNDGENVDLYDAQLYFLSQEREDPAKPPSDRDRWLSAARSGYLNVQEKEVTITGQDYTILLYECNPGTSPFHHGVSAFSAKENFAFCAELTCREGFTQDLETVLTDFLENLSFRKTE